MGAAENRAKNSKMAADLKARGIYHGKRLTKGLSNIPENLPGSAAYRRLMERRRRGNAAA